MGEIFACASASSTLGYISSMMYDNLDRQVLSTSEIVVIGSLLVNEVLLRCLRHKLRLPALEPPFYNACFLQSLKAAGARESKAFTVVKHVIASKFHNYPHIERSRGDAQAITIAAKDYGTNLKTSTKTSFFCRQRAFLRFWLQRHGLESQKVSRQS